MDVILITRQLETATMLLCLSSRIIQQNKQNGSENYQIKTSKLHKHPEYVSDILNHTSSSDTMYFHVQIVILT